MVRGLKNNKGISLKVNEKFFDIFEKERVKEQNKIQQQTGRFMNLSQMKFTTILAQKQFNFNFPKRIIKRKLKRRKRR